MRQHLRLSKGMKTEGDDDDDAYLAAVSPFLQQRETKGQPQRKDGVNSFETIRLYQAGTHATSSSSRNS